MNSDAIKLIYFSPTATTRKIVEEIARGISLDRPAHLNLTRHDSKDRQFPELHGELAIIGMPVYAGRLPAEAVSRFRAIKGNNTPAVIVVVYGNRAYEDALLELRNIAIEAGFRPIAGAAFIGEHSYSSDDAQIAFRRPDAEDLRHAALFGQKISTKMKDLGPMPEVPSLQVPGNYPYQDYRLPRLPAPVSQEFCTRCETCFSVCPTGAISLKDNTVVTDDGLCILCCACVKSCTTGARVMEDERIQKIRTMLTTRFSERKEPEAYF